MNLIANLSIPHQLFILMTHLNDSTEYFLMYFILIIPSYILENLLEIVKLVIRHEHNKKSKGRWSKFPK